MMATIPHVTSGLGLRKFQADGFLLTRVYLGKATDISYEVFLFGVQKHFAFKWRTVVDLATRICN